MSQEPPVYGASAMPELERVDAELHRLLEERAALVRGADDATALGDAVLLDPAAFERRFQRFAAAGRSSLADGALREIYHAIHAGCAALVQPVLVAYLGPRGTFSEQAAVKCFGAAAQTVPVDSIEAVFREVEVGRCAYGVVPVENSTEGMVNRTLDRLVDSTLGIGGEVEIPIHQNLMGFASDPATARVLYSHQQSLAQCRKWLDANLPGVERIAVASNGEAARLAAEDGKVLAVAGAQAAAAFDVPVIAANIEDEPNNTTRFFVVTAREAAASGNDKTSLLLSVRNRPGALYGLLEPFARRGISLNRIESRPSKNAVWEYVFFVDIDGHASEANVAQALDEVAANAALFKILGSYPKTA